MELALGIILLVVAVFLVVAVLMQQGKSHNLSGAIAGGAETFFGKSKAESMDKTLSRITTVVAIVFVIVVLIAYVIQDDVDYNALLNDYMASQETADAADTGDSADAADTGDSAEKADSADSGSESAAA